MEASLANRKQVDVRRAESALPPPPGSRPPGPISLAAELQLSYTTLVAASDVVSCRKSVEPGQIVQAGQSLDDHHSIAGRVGHGQLQGDPTGCGPSRAARGNQGGHVWPLGWEAT